MKNGETKHAIRLSALAELLCEQCIHCKEGDPKKKQPTRCPQVSKFIRILKEKSQ